MKDTNYEDGYKEGFANGYIEGFEKGRFVNFDSQEDFTERVSNLILQGKEQGFSTKGIYENLSTFEQLYYHKKTMLDIIGTLKKGNIDASNIKITEIE